MSTIIITKITYSHEGYERQLIIKTEMSYDDIVNSMETFYRFLKVEGNIIRDIFNKEIIKESIKISIDKNLVQSVLVDNDNEIQLKEK